MRRAKTPADWRWGRRYFCDAAEKHVIQTNGSRYWSMEQQASRPSKRFD
jgi:hypothetical protein